MKSIRKLLNKNNEGSAIIVVLVAVAFTFILITTLLFITLSNILMKYSDARIKNNFYTAETVAEQIKAGLEDKSSEAFSDTYKLSLTYYNGGASQETMVQQYLSDITKNLCKGTDNTKWDEEKLLAMVDDGLKNGTDSENLDLTAFSEEEGRPHNILRTTTGVTLENIYIKYTNPTDNTVSIIQTNYVLTAPYGSFAYSSQLPDIFDYAIIAGQHMTVASGTDVRSWKSIYGGDKGIDIGESIQGSLTMNDRHYLVTKGTVSLNGRSSGSEEGKLVTSTLTDFYARDIEVNKGKADLGGKTTVSDDLVFKGAGTVTVSGNYTGFGNSETDATSSSAVLINAKNARFDTSKAKQVILAGHAFIGEDTASEHFAVYDEGSNLARSGTSNYWTSDTEPIVMGQSVAAKADQVAYLIPPECIGVDKGNTNVTDIEIVKANPAPNIMKKPGTNEPDFSYYTAGTTNFKGVDFYRQLDALGGHDLNYFSPKDRYAVRYVRSQYGDALAYFYLIMSPDKAEEYVECYRKYSTKKADKYFKFYDPSITGTADSASTVTEGQSFTYISGGTGVTMQEPGSPQSIISSSVYEQRYLNLCAKLIENGVTSDELKQNIFENVLFADDIDAKVGSGKTLIYTIGSEGNEVKGILTGEDTYTYGSDDSIRLIISTGDVVVTKDFKGLIIARGSITLNGGTIKLESDRTGLARVLQTYKLTSGDKAEKPLIQYFRDWEQYPLDGIVSLTAEETGEETVSSNMELSEYTDYSELVHYDKFTKK
ncbi:MAG: hypothetical protein J6O71_07140 [Lachnospiraceae bacterium]|nr:hypothetical protein [Lachnospiraceae bacterium]